MVIHKYTKKEIKTSFTESEYGYVMDCMEGCIHDSLREDDGVPSISHKKLKKLWVKITGREFDE